MSTHANGREPDMPRRLTALDASFLYLERKDFPMHVGSVATFEGEPLRKPDGTLRTDDLLAQIEQRLPFSARWRVEWPLGWGRPYWVVDEAFDITNHVRFTHVDPPGDDGALRALAATLHGPLLDRGRPLWELWFVDGVADGRVALVQKVHHALVDGLAGVDVGTAVLDLDRAGTPLTSGEPRHSVRDGSGLGGLPLRVALTSRELLIRGAQAARVTTSAVTLLAPHSSTRRTLGDVGRGLRTFVPRAIAPRTSLNEAVGPNRSYATFSMSLDTARRVRAERGGTVNDVVLSIVTAALRAVLVDEGREIPDAVHALVPVADRPPERRGDVGNRVAAMIVPLPIAEPDTAQRYDTIRSLTARLKGSGEVSLTGSVLAAADYFPEPLTVALARLVHRQPFVNVVVTNVPGPPIPLYILGALMLEVFPVVPLARNLSLSVAILSYGDQLNIGLVADTERWPDLSRVVRALGTALHQLAPSADAPSVHLEAS